MVKPHKEQEADHEGVSLVSPRATRSDAPPPSAGLGRGGLSAAEFFTQATAATGGAAGQQAGQSGSDAFRPRHCPEENANFISRWLFLYVDGLIKAGAKKHFEQQDLWDMAKQDEAARVAQHFNKVLRETATGEAPRGVVWRALWRCHGRVFLATGIIKIVHDLVMFMPPYVLERLLHHMAAGGSRLTALWWCFLLLFVALAENITVNIYFHMLYRMSLHIKIEMIQMIYDKSLKITGAVKSEMGVGSIVNLQSNDASKIWNTPMYMHVLWNGPFQIFIVMAMLVRIMGWGPAMAGLAVTVIMIPLTTVLGKALAKVRRAMVKQTDGRVKLATEIITGIKAIKLYAWEDAYMQRINTLRDEELRHIRKTQLLSMLNSALYSAGPVFVALAAFSVHSLLGYSLTAAVAFPALSLFNLLRFPIIMFPSQIMNMIHARVGLQRIQGFLENEEMSSRGGPTSVAGGDTNAFATAGEYEGDEAPLLSLHLKNSSNNPTTYPTSLAIQMANAAAATTSNGYPRGFYYVDVEPKVPVAAADATSAPVAIRMTDAIYSWESSKEPVLKGVSLSVEQGMLVMVVGQVGSGKSSLLCALLREMHRVSGSVEVVGTIAYTAQDPWIQNTTLKRNILMGKAYDDDLYTSTLAACALGPDLEMLPAGDATEIGEKGVNLSGGQKHRVALARAVYANADVYLLDDPLSAVDAHVGRRLFDDCICGLLEGHTRVLVTHQLQYLPAADLVVVMADGEIKDMGSYDELIEKGTDLNQFVKKAQKTQDSTAGSAGDDATQGTGGVTHAAQHPAGSKAGQQPGEVQGKAGQANGNGSVSTPRHTAVTLQVEEEGGAEHHRSPFRGAGTGHTQANGHSSPTKHSLATKSIQLINLDDAAATESVAGTQTGAATQGTGEQQAEGGEDQTQAEEKFERTGSKVRFESTNHRQLVPTDSQIHRSIRPQFTMSVVERPPELILSPRPREAGGSPRGLRALKSEAFEEHGSSLRPAVSRSERASLRRTQSHKALAGARESLRRTLTLKEQDGKLVKVEERAVGQVDRAIYRAYLDAWCVAWAFLPLAVVVLAFSERGLQVGQNYVLSFWSDDTTAAQREGREPHTKWWLTLYFMLGMLSIGAQMIRAVATVAGSISASRSLHKGLLEKVVRLPMSFYDSQPTGRLLNRLTKDTESVDIQVSGSVNSALTCVVNCVLSVVVVAIVTPIALVALVPLTFIYYRVQNLYIASSRELKRLDSLAFSPIFQHFSESLHGLATIRAFDKQRMFALMNQANVDNSNRAYWPIQVVNRWLSVRLEIMGAMVVFVAAVSITVLRPSSPGLVGLAITSALNLTNLMNWMVRQMTELEVNMNSVERMVEYLKYDEEAPAVLPSKRPPAGWPHEGNIEARNLTVRYRPDLDPVLRNLSFTIYSKEKIGVCGRTGCGKSTLMITLYRLIEPCGGQILIDQLDICSIGLRDLRSKLSLVPQDPVIFSGTIRSNLDPFDAIQNDSEIWEALRRAGMDDHVKSLGGGLSAPIKEGGANLSVGQRQLLCMARALLRKSRILVLDEATSNVDNATDGLIQSTIRSAFEDCTVLTIAHRLHTIIDSSRILLLNAGQLEEFDTPHNLLQKPDSFFRRLVEETTKGGGLNAGAVADALAAAVDSAH